MQKPFLSVVIPAYNEVSGIALTLLDVHRHLSKQGSSYEIIVVDDGSIDDTVGIARRMKEVIPHLSIIANKTNHGKGKVVRQGILAAQGRIRLFMDADNSTSVDQFGKMRPYFEQGYHVVIGSRDIAGAQLIPAQPWHRVLLGNAGNLIIQALLLPGIYDTQCGFKAFSETAAEEIFSRATINRWGFDVEALSLARVLGYQIKEIPVVWSNNPFSRVGAGAYIQVLWETLLIRISLWTNKYNISNAKKKRA